MRIRTLAAALVFSCSAAFLAGTALASEPAVGTLVTLGTYEQDDVTENGPEDLRWLVMDSQDGNLLLLSLCTLDTVPFDTESGTSVWADCSLRSWLNEDFFSEAFTQEEQDAILTTTVDNNQGSADWDTPEQEDTEDKLFLFSYQEVSQYLKGDDGKMCFSTEYCRNKGAMVAKGTYQNQEYWFAAWWLRSAGPDEGTAAVIQAYGLQGRYDSVSANTYGVRPALWIPADYFNS